MKIALLAAAAITFLTAIAGCAVVPAGPVVYGPPAGVVVVRPGYSGYGYAGRHYWHRDWR